MHNEEFKLTHIHHRENTLKKRMDKYLKILYPGLTSIFISSNKSASVNRILLEKYFSSKIMQEMRQGD